MKFFLAGLYQETNSFSPARTDLELFRREKLIGGPEVLDEIKGSNLELAGMVEEIARRFPAAVVAPGLHAWGIASGPVEDAAFAELSDRILARLKAASPVDAVLLALHGAMASVSCEDCAGALLERVRLAVGPAVPIAVSLDLHAALSARILRQADVLAGYRTYPHVDQAATGRRVVAALARRGERDAGWRPVTRRWPALIPVDNAQTESGPFRELAHTLEELDRDPEVLTASMFCAHPWFDTREQGATLLAYAAPGAAARVAEAMESALRRLWQRRSELLLPCPDAEGFFQGLPGRGRPVAAIDAGDITTAGAPGDSTVMLRAAIEAQTFHTLIPLVDAPTVAAAHAAGAGRPADFSPGGSDEPRAYNFRVPLRAEVERLIAEPVRLKGAAFGGMTLNLGPRALLRAGCVRLLVSSHSSWIHDPEFWRSAGVDPGAADVVVQKSHKLFQPAYAGIVREVVTVETPGCTDRRLSRLPYRRAPRPIFPLEEADNFNCVANSTDPAP